MDMEQGLFSSHGISCDKRKFIDLRSTSGTWSWVSNWHSESSDQYNVIRSNYLYLRLSAFYILMLRKG